MKFHKRPMDDREKAFAMSQVLVDCACNCTGLKCICPSIPTHQVQLDQTSQEQTNTHMHTDRNAINW